MLKKIEIAHNKSMCIVTALCSLNSTIPIECPGPGPLPDREQE